MGGTETMVHVPMMSPTQKPGHVTSGIMHKCRQRGTRPPAGIGSSRDCGAVHLRNIGIHFVSKVFEVLRTVGKLRSNAYSCTMRNTLLHFTQKLSDKTCSAPARRIVATAHPMACCQQAILGGMTQNRTRQRARPQWKQKPYALYIASLVFPTLVAYVFGNPDMIPSSIESVTSAITRSAIVI